MEVMLLLLRALPAVLSLYVVALHPSASRATTIVPVAQTRSVTATASHPFGTPSSQSQSASDFGPFNGHARADSVSGGDRTTADITQTSTIGTDRIDLVVDGRIDIGVFGGPDTGTASSLLDVTFDLTVASQYALSHAITFTGNDVRVRLSDAQGVLVELLGFGVRGGLLAPGRYRVEALFDADGVAGGRQFLSQEVTLLFTLVPEPSTAALLLSGIALLAARRVDTQPRRDPPK
jgi:hypothetical protein